MTVAAILKRKSTGFCAVSEGDSLQAVAARLAEHSTSAAVVLNAESGLAGVITEHDLVHALADRGAESTSLRALDVLSRDVHTCSLEDSEMQVMDRMTARQVRHMPVVEDGKVIAMLDLPEVVKYRMWKIGRLVSQAEQEPDKEKRLDLLDRHLKKLPADVRRAQILEAARHIIIRDGMKGLTVRNITKEAGVSPAMVSVHFGGMDELLKAVFDSIMFELPDTQGRDPVNLTVAIINLRMIVKRYFDPQYFSRTSLLIWLPVLENMLRDDDFRKNVYARDEDYVRQFAVHILRVIEFRKLDLDATTLARNLMSFMDGLWLRWCHSTRTEVRDEHAAAIDYLESKLGSLQIDGS